MLINFVNTFLYSCQPFFMKKIPFSKEYWINPFSLSHITLFRPMWGWSPLFRSIELRMLYPAFRNAVVTQVCNDAVVTNTCIIWICSCTLHRRHSRRCAELLVILLTLLFYLHHAGGMPYPVGSRNIGALLGLIETCIWLYMSQSNSLLLLLTEDYLEPCRSMLCPV